MKKRILLLIPCILLALGLLSACGDNGSQSSGSIENQLTSATWSTSVGSLEDFEGLIDIKLPFELGKLVTIKFDQDGTGYIQIGEQLPFKINFNWAVNGGQVNLKLHTALGDHDFDLNFHLDSNSLRLEGTNINIKLDRN